MESKEKTDNELIAEFMGVPQINDNGVIVWDNQRTGKTIYCLQSRYLRYDTSWDWIMPVVEKIESLGYGFRIDPWSIFVTEYISGNENDIIHVTIDDAPYPKIRHYYHAVIKAIKWYNENKSK